MNTTYKYITSSIVLLLAITTAGCSLTSTTRAGAVGADRNQFLIVSANQMDAAAVDAYGEILGKSKAEGSLNTNKAMVQRVRGIANRLTPQTKVFRDDAPKWKWEVNVIDSEQLNAWCMPGGKIAFYSGIINKLQLSDAEIAAIMGHEIAHALREHGRERASEGQVTALGLGLLGQFTNLSPEKMQLAQTVTAVTLTLPNSRSHETEADRMGVELAARAGFDPYAAVNVWQKMAELSSGAPPEILSTHPSNASRIKDLKKYAATVSPLYKQALKN